MSITKIVLGIAILISFGAQDANAFGGRLRRNGCRPASQCTPKPAPTIVGDALPPAVQQRFEFMQDQIITLEDRLKKLEAKLLKP